MKKIIFLLILFSGKHALAQENQSISYANPSHRHGIVTWQQDETNITGFINNVNPRAARNLLKTYNNANNILWKIDDQEITAYFTKGDVHVKVRYDKDGNRISTKKVYSENKLDRYISFIAKKGLGKDFSIFLVTEINIGDNKIYEITLQNKSNWCVVKILENREVLDKICENEIFIKS
jgi:hypothetical protein